MVVAVEVSCFVIIVVGVVVVGVVVVSVMGAGVVVIGVVVVAVVVVIGVVIVNVVIVGFVDVVGVEVEVVGDLVVDDVIFLFVVVEDLVQDPVVLSDDEVSISVELLSFLVFVEDVSSVVECVFSVVKNNPFSVVESSVGKVISVGISVDVVENISSVVLTVDVVGSSVVVLESS